MVNVARILLGLSDSATQQGIPMRNLLYATTAITLLALTPAANADTIINFGQTGGVNTITGTAGLTTGTTFTGTNVAVSITQIAAATATPISAFLDITAVNTTGANLTGNLITQHFAGTFSVNSLANNTGTNFLSGVFNDGIITQGGSTSIAVTANTALFTSDVITTLGLPRSVSFGLTNVTPGASVTPCTASSCAGGDTPATTLSSFNASIVGNASAFPTTAPEPASLALLGTALVGLGFAGARRRRSRRDA
jgi:hypothetical protein